MTIAFKNHDGTPAVLTTSPAAVLTPAPTPNKTAKSCGKARVRSSGPVKPAAPLIDLNQPGRLHVCNLLALYGLKSTSRLYEKIGLKQIPSPDGRDGRRPFWKTSTIRQHLES